MARPKVLLENIEADGWDLLETLAMWGSAEYCAKKLGVSVDTLERRIKEKYDYGWTTYKNRVLEPMRINLLKKQYDVAMQGNVSMLIWLGKQHLGQSDKREDNLNISSISLDVDDNAV